ncbi:M1 family metallopeptidase [Nocardioides sp. SR21]|uniref:M1 family metallopeptidase n=1 Tax=Nocardioides sp. SR21 TaxID=2919501 RepID=UPI001FA97A11|nr:M1 family metallopeptidase [Nocardioides sp. SR21]
MRRAAAGLAAAALLLTGCTSGDGGTEPTEETSPTEAAAARVDEPVEDRVYPDVGDPGVDVLSYHLDLDWDPATQTLTGAETLRIRATARASQIQLDLGEPLEVTDVDVGGVRATFDHDGKDLVIHQRVLPNRRYLVHIDYSGTPAAVPSPTERTDIASVGWTVAPSGQVWTMQEPFGAYTWYAVNDQPSDKATYSFRISAPSPAVGVANGELVSRRERDGRTITAWELDSPASSYLVTVAIGEFTMTEDESASGLPMSYWTPADRPELIDRMREAPAAVDWLEERLGPFPFDSLGYLVVDSSSGMETQTMITLGDTRYATSPEVLVHEAAHQWYGDLVTPRDWRDVWMNEGMAMYLQGVWTAEHRGPSLEALMDEWATYDSTLRGDSGPPADYDPEDFGAANVYYIPAVMWDELRQRIGDDEFWRLVREWPQANAYGNAGYDDITAWWSEQTGEDLSAFFDTWLLSETTPAADS